MKIRPFHIASSLFLAAALLFTQAGLGYFHDKHDAHEHIDQAHKDQTQLHRHGEHCKVCSIDLFLNLFIDQDVIENNEQHLVDTPGTYQGRLQSLPSTFLKGRAPPVLSI